MNIFSSVIQGAYAASKTVYECQINIWMHKFKEMGTWVNRENQWKVAGMVQHRDWYINNL